MFAAARPLGAEGVIGAVATRQVARQVVDLARAELRQAEAGAALARVQGEAPVGRFVAVGVVAAGDAQDRRAVEDVLAGRPPTNRAVALAG